MAKPTIGERSPDTNLVVTALRGVNGDVAYVALAAQVDLPVARVKTLLPSARNILRAEQGILFDVVRGVGLRRLDNQGKVKKVDTAVKKISRAAKRGEKELRTVDYGALSKTDQHHVTTQRLFFHAVRGQAQGVRKTVPYEDRG